MKFQVQGPQSLLQALQIELNNLGYSPQGKSIASVLKVDGDTYKPGDHKSTLQEYNLPEDWNLLMAMIRTNTQPKYQIGDQVVVKDDGKVYTTYSTMFYKMQFKDTIENPGGAKYGKIFAVNVHEDSYKGEATILYGLDHSDGTQTLISENGIAHHKLFTDTEKKTISKLIDLLETEDLELNITTLKSYIN